ncbi:MAG: hypothetical protein CM15mP51_13580 [Porticoccaceae bacterium]|nr:MAG: hypothetical protein CM15mP51_13580 [Porticoccaceae bacterium]
MGRPTAVFVDRDAIKSNFDIAKSFSPNSKFVSVIKANAYGHGLKEVAQTLSKCTDAFGVACIEEALLIREAGIKNPVLLMEGFFQSKKLKLPQKRTSG